MRNSSNNSLSLTTLLALFSLALFWPSGAWASTPLDIHIAVTGSDSTGDGSLANPYATVQYGYSQAVLALQGSPTTAIAATLWIHVGTYYLIPPATTPLAPGLVCNGGDVPLGSGSSITFTSYLNPNGQYDVVVFNGALHFNVNADATAGLPAAGTWSTLSTTNCYNGGTSQTSSPAAKKAVSGIQKFTFNMTAPSGGAPASMGYDLSQRIANMRANQIVSTANGTTAHVAAPVNGGHGCITQLFVNNVPKTRARHPNIREISVDSEDFNISGGYTGPASLPGTPFNYSGGFNGSVPAVPFVSINSQWADLNGGTGTADYSNILDGNTQIVFTRAFETKRAAIGPTKTLWPTQAVPGATPPQTSNPRIQLQLPDMANPFLPGSTTTLTYNEDYETALAEVTTVSSIPDRGSNLEETWNRGWLENNLLFIDVAGEWFFDDGDPANSVAPVLYYLPASGESVSSETFEIPVAFTMVGLMGTETAPITNIIFKGAGGDGAKMGSAATHYLVFEKNAWKFENGRGIPRTQGALDPSGSTYPITPSSVGSFYSFAQEGYGLSGVIDGINIGVPDSGNLADGVLIEGCQFDHFGANGVSLGGNRVWGAGFHDRTYYDHQTRGRVIHSSVHNNYFVHGGGSAVRVDDYPRLIPDTTLSYYPTGSTTKDLNRFVELDSNYIDENSIDSIGEKFSDAAGIVVVYGQNTRVNDNSVTSTPYTGISVADGTWRVYNPSGSRMQVAGNGVNGAMSRLVDGGAIYTFGGYATDVQFNNIVNTGTRDPNAIVLPTSGTIPLISDIYLDGKTDGNNPAALFLDKITLIDNTVTSSTTFPYGQILLNEPLSYVDKTGQTATFYNPSGVTGEPGPPTCEEENNTAPVPGSSSCPSAEGTRLLNCCPDFTP